MQLLNFNFDGKSVTTFKDENSTLWFIATDICKLLQHSNANQMVRDNCSQIGVKKVTINTPTRKQEKTIISEQNVYRLIFKSNLSAAKKFQDWIFDYVLPGLFEKGTYSNPEKIKKSEISSGLEKFKSKKKLNPEDSNFLTVLELIDTLTIFSNK